MNERAQFKVDPRDLKRFQKAARRNGQTMIGAFRLLSTRFMELTAPATTSAATKEQQQTSVSANGPLG